jgi:uncharacterized LabA/DUF88 family protein
VDTVERALGMVDAGFLSRATGAALKLDVSSFDFEPIDVRNWFRYSAALIDREFLRAYWYDGAYPPGSHLLGEQMKQFSELESAPGIQLRLGRLERRPNSQKSAIRRAVEAAGGDWSTFCENFDLRDELQQKGVDTLIVLDMVRLARDGAFQTLLLMSGDADLVEAVRTVQDAGREVILGVPVGAGVAPELRRVVDELVVIQDMQLRRMLKDKPGLQSYIDYPDQ